MTEEQIFSAASRITDLIDILCATAAGEQFPGVRDTDNQERQKICEAVADIIREEEA